MGRIDSPPRAEGPTEAELGTDGFDAVWGVTVAMAAIGVSPRQTLVGPTTLVVGLVGSFAAFAKSLLLIHRWWPLGMERSQLI